MKEKKFLMIELKGTPFEMGYKYGFELKDLIATSIKTFYNLIYSILYKYFSIEESQNYLKKILESIEKAIPITEKYAPEVIEEMYGISKGSGFSIKEIFTLNSYLEIIERINLLFEKRITIVGCSSYAVGSLSTIERDTFIGWNADDHESWLKSSIIIKGIPTKKPPFISWNFAGCIGRPGMNPYLGLSAATVFSSDLSLGVPYCVISRKILQQKSVVDAIEVISKVKRMGSMSYTIGDIEGNVATIETTSNNIKVIEGINRKVIHTSNYLSGDFKRYEIMKEKSFDNSKIRLNRLKELILDRDEPVTKEFLKKVHRDHENKPNSICRHKNNKGNDIMTVTALICQPSQRKMLVAYGLPCKHSFLEYIL
ncbi:MAG: C45 family peptidase [Actinobacteria bacterium]|nr:C45 family peptidase [Actinomycetota bacterium]